jgi:Ca-activated chloride channel family protein
LNDKQSRVKAGNDDYLTLITFSSSPVILVEHERVGTAREQAVTTIERLVASGGTSLFDAIGDGAAVMERTTSPLTTNVMVVLTDGQDTASNRFNFNPELVAAATARDTTVFTIAYGDDADENILASLAHQAKGNLYRGSEASIAAIYEEMSAAFGGSAGVGR